jgi:hypothetical protein
MSEVNHVIGAGGRADGLDRDLSMFRPSTSQLSHED